MKEIVILSLFFVVINSIDIGANTVQTLYKNGSELVHSIPIVDGDTCIFMLSDVENANWTFCVKERNVYTGEEYWTQWKHSSEVSSFTITPREFPDRWTECAVTFNTLNNHRISHGIVVCEHNSEKDTVYILFDVLPTKPVIKSIEYRYDYFDTMTGHFSNAYFDMTLDIPDPFEKIMLGFSPFFESGDILYYDYPDIKRIDDTTYLLTAAFSLYQDVVIITKNFFGWAHNDTIQINDYIDDPIVLDFIREETDANVVPYSSTSYYISDGVLYINGAYSIVAYTLDGKLKSVSCNEQLDIKTFDKGIYIIKVKTSNNQYNFKLSL